MQNSLKCPHPSDQNADRSDAVVIGGAYRAFAAIRDQWRRIFSAHIEEKRDPNSKNRSFLAQRPKNQS